MLKVRGEFLCGASMISSRWLVTASHCVLIEGTRQLEKVSDFELVAGLHDRTKADEPGRVTRKAEAIFWDHSFHWTTGNGDIALIKLSEDLPLNGTAIAPVCLPEVQEKLNAHIGEAAVISGWGKNDTSKFL